MRAALIVLVAGSLSASGCATPLRVSKAELGRLHGFRGGDAVALRDVRGAAFPFTRDSHLTLALAGGEEITQRYGRIDLIDGVFYGAVEGTGAQVAVALSDVDHVRVSSTGKGEAGKVGLMVLTMWLLIGVLAFIGWAIYEHADLDDADIDLIIVSN